MVAPHVVSQSEWAAAREQLLRKEKAATHALDALAAERRRLPMVRVEKTYSFQGTDRTYSLNDLFEGRRQLIVYHHMLKPHDKSPCSGCSMFVDSLQRREHLLARNTNLVLVSRAPIDEIEAFRKRMGWTLPWYSTRDAFNADYGVTDGFGLNVFFKDGSDVYHTYYTTQRGVETLGTTWTLLDLTPFGRQEEWEDSPPGWPQSKPYQWWRLHDEY